jgi:hypothetical protein
MNNQRQLKVEIVKILKWIALVFFAYLLIYLIVVYTYFGLFSDTFANNINRQTNEKLNSKHLNSIKAATCHFHFDQCFNIYNCPNFDNNYKLKVYVYLTHYEESIRHFSEEFMQYVNAIVESDYYESDPTKACLFVPMIDLLNGNLINRKLVEKQLRNSS